MAGADEKIALFTVLQRAVEERDWPSARTNGEALLAIMAEDTPRARAPVHLLLADAAMSGGGGSAALEAATTHFRAVIAAGVDDVSRRGYVYLELGRAELSLARAGDQGARERALTAFDSALQDFPEATAPARRAEAYMGIARGRELQQPPDIAQLRAAADAYRAAYELFGLAQKTTDSDPEVRRRRLGNQGVAAYHLGRTLADVARATSSSTELASARAYLAIARDAYRAAGRLEEAEDADATVQAIEPSPPELDLEAVKRALRDDSRRPSFLRSWLDHHVSADAERVAFIDRTMIAPGASEVVATALEGQQTGDRRTLARAAQHDRMLQEHREFLLETDRAKSTHAEAEAILRRHLGDGTRFVLILRNFDIELTKAFVPEARLPVYERIQGQPLEYVRTLVIQPDRFQEELATLLAADGIPVVAISDIGDVIAAPTKTRNLAKLRVLSADWELVASMLIGQASAVVLFAQSWTEGIHVELKLLVQHAAVPKTSLLLVPDGPAGMLGETTGRERPDLPALLARIRGECGDGFLQTVTVDPSSLRAIADRVRESIGRRAP